MKVLLRAITSLPNPSTAFVNQIIASVLSPSAVSIKAMEWATLAPCGASFFASTRILVPSCSVSGSSQEPSQSSPLSEILNKILRYPRLGHSLSEFLLLDIHFAQTKMLIRDAGVFIDILPEFLNREVVPASMKIIFSKGPRRSVRPVRIHFRRSFRLSDGFVESSIASSSRAYNIYASLNSGFNSIPAK